MLEKLDEGVALIECPNCGHRQNMVGRYCINCKKEFKSFDKKFESSSIYKILLFIIFSIVMSIFWAWGLSLGILRFDHPIAYIATFGVFLNLFICSLIMVSIVGSKIRKEKSDTYKDNNSNRYYRLKNTLDIDDKECVTDEIKYLNMVMPSSLCNLYFTDKRIVVFSLTGVVKTARIKKIKTVDNEIEKLKKDIKKLIDFYPFNIPIKYSNISKVVIGKRDISLVLQNPEKGKNRTLSFLIVNYDRKDKKGGPDYLPVFSKYLSSKLFDKKGNCFYS